MKLLPAGIGLAMLMALAACGSAASSGSATNKSPTASTSIAASVGDNGIPPQSKVACSVLPSAAASAVVQQPVDYPDGSVTTMGGYPYESVCYYTVGNNPTGGSFYNLQAEVYCGPNEPAAWQTDIGSTTEAFPRSSISGARIMSTGTNPDSATALAQAPGNMIVSVEDVGVGPSGEIGSDNIDTGLEPLLGRLLSKVYDSAVSQSACKQIVADAGSQSQ